jgi:hypothetical protein
MILLITDINKSRTHMNTNKALLIVLSFGTITGTVTCNEQKQSNPIESQFKNEKSNPFVFLKNENQYTPLGKYQDNKEALSNFPTPLYYKTSNGAEALVYDKETNLNESSSWRLLDIDRDIYRMLPLVQENDELKTELKEHSKYTYISWAAGIVTGACMGIIIMTAKNQKDK